MPSLGTCHSGIKGHHSVMVLHAAYAHAYLMAAANAAAETVAQQWPPIPKAPGVSGTDH